MSWLQTSPSGSVRMCLSRYESDVAVFVLSKPLRHPVSILDLSWRVISPPSIYRFHINSWSIADKNDVLEPCSSPAGLFSFEADILDGRLLSVTPGPLDHASLLSFFTKMSTSYPHKTQSQLMELARTISFEEAFETATLVWTSLGAVWTQIDSKTLATASNGAILWNKDVDVTAEFEKALGKVSKRLYRDVETANRLEVRSQLLALDNPVLKRAKLMSSRKTAEKQELESNTETLFRKLLMRSVNLPHSLASSSTPFKSKSKKKKEKSTTSEPESEEIDVGSGGFVRTAQLLSQLTPEAVQVIGAKHSIHVKATCTPNLDPNTTEITSTISAKLSLAGLACSVAHLSHAAAWFMWRKPHDSTILKTTIADARAHLSNWIPNINAEFARVTGVGNSANDSQLDLKKKEITARVGADALWRTWSINPNSSMLTREDIAYMLEFTLKKKPTDDDVSTVMNKISATSGPNGPIERNEEFDSWAQKESTKSMYYELRFDCQSRNQPSSSAKKDKKASSSSSSSKSSAPADTATQWEPCVLIVDLLTSTASVYGGKNVVKAQGDSSTLKSSELKKSLLGSFSWKTQITMFDGDEPNAVSFGRTATDPLYTIKFKAADMPLIQRAVNALVSINGIGSEISHTNQLQHSLQMIDLAIPALVSLGQPLPSLESKE